MNTVRSCDVGLGEPIYESICFDPKYSFYWHCHDFPHELARWNYHPEYELHLIRESCGNYFVGDYLGRFQAGNLVLIGPNVPHAWYSDIERGWEVIEGRDVVLQFSGEWIDNMIALCPELRCLIPLLKDASRGIEFFGQETNECARLLIEMEEYDDSARLLAMLTILRRLSRSQYMLLASPEYDSTAQGAATEVVDAALCHIHNHFNEELKMSSLASSFGMTPSSFSRFFKNATGDTFVAFVRRIRIIHACRLLVESDHSIAEICFMVGFNNLSNFNRHFRTLKGMTPREYQYSVRGIK